MVKYSPSFPPWWLLLGKQNDSRALEMSANFGLKSSSNHISISSASTWKNKSNSVFFLFSSLLLWWGELLQFCMYRLAGTPGCFLIEQTKGALLSQRLFSTRYVHGFCQNIKGKEPFSKSAALSVPAERHQWLLWVRISGGNASGSSTR